MRAPVAIQQFLGDERIGCGDVRNAQIDFRECEQRQALVALYAVLLQEAVDPASSERRTLRAHQLQADALHGLLVLHS